MAHDVFISYSSKDQAVADAVCASLEAKAIECWIAPRDILPGMPYAEALTEAVEASRALLLVLSSSSVRSEQVVREVEAAVSKGIPVIPFRIEDVTLSKSLKHFLKAIHWLNALTPPLEKHLATLPDKVGQLLAQRPEVSDPAAGPAEKPPVLQDEEQHREKPAPGRLRAWLKAGVILVGAVLALAIAYRIGSLVPKEPAEAAVIGQGLWVQAALSQPAPPQVIDGDVVRDFDYAFELRRPSADWEFLDHSQVLEVSPDACMGLANARTRGHVFVIVEQVSVQSLQDYADLLTQAGPVTERTEHSRKDVKLAGQAALEIVATAKSSGVEQKSVQYLVAASGFCYQLIGAAPARDFPANEAAFRGIAESFRFLPERTPQARAPEWKSRNQRGADWKIAGDRYENASFGFRLTVPDGWRYAGSAELAQISTDAAVAVLSTRRPIYQRYLVEPAGGVDPDQMVRASRERFQRAMGIAQPAAREKVTLGGVEAIEHVYHDVPFASAKMDMALVFFHRGQSFYQVHSWWPAGQRKVAQPEVRQTYGFLSFLTSAETARLEQELITADPENTVGPHYCLRNGLYRDFRAGFTFRKPPGLWVTRTAEQIQDRHPGALLLCESPSLGIYLMLFAERVPGVPARKLHDVILANMGQRDAPVRAEKHGDLEMLISTYEQTIEDLRFGYFVASTARGDRHVRMVLFGLQANVKEAARLLPKVLAGLEVPVEPPVAQKVSPKRITDYRLGFEFDAPEAGWSVQAEAFPELAAVASMVNASSKGVECYAMAICTPTFSEERAFKGLLGSVGVQDFNLGNRRETEDTLGRLPAKRVDLDGRMKGTPVGLTVWLARRANTTYLFMVLRERRLIGSADVLTAEACQKSFALID